MSSFQKQSMSKNSKLWDKKANNEEFKEPIKKSKLAESGKSKSPAAVSSKIMSMKFMQNSISKDEKIKKKISEQSTEVKEQQKDKNGAFFSVSKREQKSDTKYSGNASMRSSSGAGDINLDSSSSSDNCDEDEFSQTQIQSISRNMQFSRKTFGGSKILAPPQSQSKDNQQMLKKRKAQIDNESEDNQPQKKTQKTQNFWSKV